MEIVCAACGEQTESSETCSACGDDPLLDGRYRLEALIGQGASGLTYRATRIDDGLVVAIKELSYRTMQSFEMDKLFRREADVLKQLDHPGIPSYVDDFTVQSGKHLSLYLVQEFVDGESLEAEMEHRRYTESEVLEILGRTRRHPVLFAGASPAGGSPGYQARQRHAYLGGRAGAGGLRLGQVQRRRRRRRQHHRGHVRLYGPRAALGKGVAPDRPVRARRAGPGPAGAL